MPDLLTLPAPARPALADHRTAAAWTRIVIGVLAVAIPVALVLGGTQPARTAGPATVRAALTAVSSALRAEHTADGGWPAELVAVDGVVLDGSGRRIATLPAGVTLGYERSVDGTRAVLTVAGRGATASFDSGRATG